VVAVTVSGGVGARLSRENTTPLSTIGSWFSLPTMSVMVTA